jgi:choline kinase
LIEVLPPAVILAAGQGTRLAPITDDVPKCLVPVGGVTILDRAIARLEEAGFERVVVVVGHLAHRVADHLGRARSELARRAVLVHNHRFADLGNFYSLLVAREVLGGGGFVKIDGDLVFAAGVLRALMAAPGPAVLAVDRSPGLGAEQMKTRERDGRVVALSKRIDPAEAAGESIGIERIDAEAAPRVFAELAAMCTPAEGHEYYERAYERLMQQGMRFGAADVTAHAWAEIDDHRDLAEAERLAAPGRL